MLNKIKKIVLKKFRVKKNQKICVKKTEKNVLKNNPQFRRYSRLWSIQYGGENESKFF